MNLPKDPFILLSYLNTKLRNQYQSLDELCMELQADKEQLTSSLSAIGYFYNQKLNQFVQKD
ncbi:DUF4250 domain-containing protein [Herbinix luporum]|jgi:hypothetical protein|uniref:DUF4250 domain-containing protein n=1 Tax=Herbinix luporum TaxID=1679721 RepID=A0A0K8J7L4_9FIRM|nr:DUF4250 domain-containing protein [Herbinix luporum]MDI9488010.1 DUF4250 domain-containing protein [Bacillota bacterium]CUH93525.1 hypothetical protein SD1D_1989 [Herbinix luporum]HHT56162.1 DUF4250 domain-containing protein [Herbinix luporum]